MGVVPSPYWLTIRARVDGVPDEFGNVAVSWVERDWNVRSVAPGAMADPSDPNRDRGDIAFTVHADVDSGPPTRLDQVIVGGEPFRVDGEPDDWTRGPWPNPAAGVVVELSRIEG